MWMELGGEVCNVVEIRFLRQEDQIHLTISNDNVKSNMTELQQKSCRAGLAEKYKSTAHVNAGFMLSSRRLCHTNHTASS